MGLMEEKLLLTPRGCLPDPIVRPQCQEGDVGGPSEGTFREASELLQVSLVEGFPKEYLPSGYRKEFPRGPVLEKGISR